MLVLFLYGYVGLLGVCIGSFLNVVIHRLPRRESVIRPRSRCPQCGARLVWHHNVPVLSYLGLRGRCATCRAPIPRSYLLVEVGTAVTFIVLFHLFGWSWLLLRYATLAALLIAAAEIDRRHGIIPNRLVAVGSGLGLTLMLVINTNDLGPYVLAAVACAGLLLLIRIGSSHLWGRPGLGLGDVKLVAMMGLYLGWSTLWIFYLAMVLGGTLGLVGLLTQRFQRTTLLPLAPFIALGTGLHWTVLPPSLLLPV